jgi:hypothetical protein
VRLPKRPVVACQPLPPPPPPPPPSGPCSLEMDTDFSGHDVDTHNLAPNVSACCALCSALPACNFFTYETVTLNCWLKSSDAGRQPYADHISGRNPKAPPPPPPPPPSPPPPPPPPRKGPAVVNGLFVDAVRMPRARFPNGDSQQHSGLCFSKPQFPSEGCPGYIQAGTQIAPFPDAGTKTSGLSFDIDRGLSPTQGCLQCTNYGTFQYSIYNPPACHPVYNQPLPGIGWDNSSYFTFWGSLHDRTQVFSVNPGTWTNKTWVTGIAHQSLRPA